jgi:hypothetical protein
MPAQINALESILQEQVSANRLQNHLVRFSTLFRDSGTDDERQAAAYLVDQLESFGLSPQALSFRSLISWPREGRLIVHLENDGHEEIPVRTRAFGGSTTPEGLTANLALIPFAEPEKGAMIFSHRAIAGDYSGSDVAGQIVITGDGGPDGIRRAQEHGAVAHIHVWPSDEDAIHEMIATPVWGTPTPETALRMPGIPALGLTNADGKRLESLISDGDVTVTLTSNVETAWVDLPVVTVDIAGTESDRFLLVGSHIDSWYEGITDNATGDASLLEMARVLNASRDKLRYGVRFAWWPGHSTGRYSGSTWYADSHFMELRERSLGYLNIDSPGSRGATIWDCRYNCGEIEAVTEAVVRELSGQAPNIRRPLKAGDQSFLGVGLPSIGAFRMLPIDHPDRKAVGGCGGGWWWHTPHDTLDKADVEVLAEDTRLYATLVARMCSPKLHPYHFGPVARDFIDAIGALQDKGAAHIDLSEALDRATEFAEAALALAAYAMELNDDADIERVNRGYLKLSRLLNPALFTIAGPYEFDPALQMPVLPGLAGASELATLDPESDRYGFLKTQLVRQRNRIADNLAGATELAIDLIRK